MCDFVGQDVVYNPGERMLKAPSQPRGCRLEGASSALFQREGKRSMCSNLEQGKKMMWNESREEMKIER